jgi:hypothetical protein
MPTRTSNRYTAQHFQDFAALLAAEREQNGPSPTLNRITAAITRLFAENSANFNRELFGRAARGQVSPATKPRPRQQPQSGTRAQDRPGLDEFIAEVNGWTPPVIIPIREDEVEVVMRFLDTRGPQS